MMRTFTLDPSFSEAYKNNQRIAASIQSENAMNPSPGVIRNLLAYSASLFVVKTKATGHLLLMAN